MCLLLLQSHRVCGSVDQDCFVSCALVKTFKHFPQILYWEFCPSPQAFNEWLLCIFHNGLADSFNSLNSCLVGFSIDRDRQGPPLGVS